MEPETIEIKASTTTNQSITGICRKLCLMPWKRRLFPARKLP